MLGPLYQFVHLENAARPGEGDPAGDRAVGSERHPPVAPEWPE